MNIKRIIPTRKDTTFKCRYNIPFTSSPNETIFGVAKTYEVSSSGEVLRLVNSLDGWQSVTPLAFLPKGAGSITGMYCISDDIILIATINGLIYRSVSPFDSLTLVLKMTTVGAYARNWSFTGSEDGSLVFIGEYGFKDSSNNARRIYMSTNLGETFTEVAYIPQSTGSHVHKILYDNFTDILWVSNGDLVTNRRLSKLSPPNYDNLQIINTTIQPTDGLVFNDFLLWCQDSTPFGLYKQNKSDNSLELIFNISSLFPEYADTAYYMAYDGQYLYFTTTPDSSDIIPSAIFMSVYPFTDWKFVTKLPHHNKLRFKISHLIMYSNKLLAVVNFNRKFITFEVLTS